MTPQTEPTPIVPTTDLATDVATTLAALQIAMEELPLDVDLTTPRAVEQNFVRRSSLYAHASRLQVAAQRVRELAPLPVLYSDWIDTLTACQVDLTAQLMAMETDATHSLRATTLVGQLRQSIADVANGPDLVGSGEFMTDVLVQWFKDHHVSPLPGESGIFSGRGGLHSAKLRLAEQQRLLAQAQADLEHSLLAAQALLAVKEATILR